MFWLMRRNTALLYVIVLVVAFAACRSNSVKHRLDSIESYIQEHPDSALAAIKAIDTNALSSQYLKAQYSLLHAMALDKNYIDTTDIRVIQPAIDYYDRHGNNDQKAKVYYYLGRIQYNGKNDTDAVQSFTRAFELIEKTNDLKYKKLISFSLYLVYARTYDSAEALQYAKLSYETAKQDADSVGTWILTARLAECYHNVRDNSSADSLFSIFISHPIIDTTEYAKAVLFYAKILVLKNPSDPEKSIHMFQECRRLGGKLSLENYYVYAYALLKSGQTGEAKKIIDQLNKFKISPLQETTKATWNYRINKYLGNNKEALHYFEKTIASQDSLLVKTLQQSLSKSQKDYYAEKSSKIELQRKTENLRFALLIAILLIILLFFIGFYYRRSQKWKIRVDKIESLNNDISKQLLDNLARESQKDQTINKLQYEYIQAHKKHFRTINDLCAAYLEPSNKSDQQKIYDEIIEGLQALINGDESPSEAEKIANQEFDDIITRIRKDCPKHSEQTYRLYSFLFMGFSLKTIALILNISHEAVRVSKHRLKKEISSLNIKKTEDYLDLLL